MVAFSLPEAVSRPFRSLTQSPLLMAIALHAAVLLVPLALLGRSSDPVGGDAVTLTELPPITTAGGSVDSSFAPPLDGSVPPLPPDGSFQTPGNGDIPGGGGGFQAEDGGFQAPADGGGFQASDGGFQAPADDGGFQAPADDGGFQAPADDGFVPPASSPPPATTPPNRPAANTTANRPGANAAPATSAPEASPDEAPSDTGPAATGPAATAPANPDTPSETAARPSQNPIPDGSPSETGVRVPNDAEIRLASVAGSLSGARRVTFANPELYENERSFQSGDRPEVVKTWYEQRLRRLGFRVTPVQSSGDRTVLEVTNGTVTQYLYLLGNAQTPGTNIVWSTNPLGGNLNNLQVEPVEVSNFFNGLPIPQPGEALFAAGAVAIDQPEEDRDPKASPVWRPLTLDQLSNPSPFYQGTETRLLPRQLTASGTTVDCSATPNACITLQPDFRDGVRRAVVRSGLNPEGVLQELRPALEAYEVGPPTAYGGGNLYVIRKDNQTAYLSLVPTKDGDSTAVILWNRSPLNPAS